VTHSQQASAARVIRPLRDFLATESAGGVILVVAAVAARVWANSPWSDAYFELWSTEVVVGIGSHALEMDLQHWVNDGLMTLFFFVVGLEIKRELVAGELRDPRAAALPAIAAVGGMVVPAALYLALNRSGEPAEGWGIPMATDIAMAVGVLSLFSRRVPASLKLFLLALAIVDDIGAILVIAVFYTAGVDPLWLLGGGAVIGVMMLLRALGVTRLAPFVVLGTLLWFTVHESGVHATIAGVILGLLTPTRPFRRAELIDADELTDLSSVEAARETATLARQSVSVVEYLEHVLHPWTSLVIVPIFALANAGVTVSGGALSDALGSSVAQGVVVGLVVGKFVGISSFTWVALRSRVGVLPKDATWSGLLAVAALGGIGFTVSLFVASLAYGGAALDEAKIGILVASLIAAALGSLLVLRLPRRSDLQPADLQREGV
jgi:NhaA family Na+:H+ antiporter